MLARGDNHRPSPQEFPMRSICSPVHGVVLSVLVVAHLVAQQHDHAAARYAVERGAWAEAAALVPQPSRYLYADALTYFAKALGAARTGNLVTARAAIDSLRALADRLEEQKENLLGRAQAASLSGDREKAARYYRLLLKTCER